ncbi:MAG: TonB-dependent receptor [Sandaracinaceae bacterium]|nr:TonB-dependent receptor [Sandaracinaceae bacterium]
MRKWAHHPFCTIVLGCLLPNHFFAQPILAQQPTKHHQSDATAGLTSTQSSSSSSPTQPKGITPQRPEGNNQPSRSKHQAIPPSHRASPLSDFDSTSSEAESDTPSLFSVRAEVERDRFAAPGRASTEVRREEMRERLAASAPDALRWVPGVFVQQTTHGQASPYVRGVTGQQVLHLFDGIRLNNGIYRQGPNQYFFTVDVGSLERIEVQRGSASTRWGSDALGGVVIAVPLEPHLDPQRDGFHLEGRILGRFGTQSPSIIGGLDAGGRLELNAQIGRQLAILVGGGYRHAEPLQGGGVLHNPLDGQPTLVPLVEKDGRTQRGTGFRYGVFDGRLVYQLNPELRLIAAIYGFRQYDTPRADRCPPPIGNERDCTVFLEQFRTLTYLALRGSAGPHLSEIDITFSYQRHHEIRELREAALFATTHFRDNVDSFGIFGRFASSPLSITPQSSITLRWGGDFTIDSLRSSAFLIDRLLMRTRALARGLYADRSRFGIGGIFVEGELAWEAFRFRSGFRWALAFVRVPGNEQAFTQPLRLDFHGAVGRLGLEYRPDPAWALALNIDQGFRPPNLDDLTSRQIIGPGFQFENPELRPERSTTYEIGMRLRENKLAGAHSLSIDFWIFAMELEHLIARAPRQAMDCPPDSPECRTAFSRFQVVNLPGPSWILGSELAIRLRLHWGIDLSTTFAFAWGEGPSPELTSRERLPLSRIMPPNGTAEVRYTHPDTQLFGTIALRWAASQDRLALSDHYDARIPLGGTPAFAVFDLRAGWKLEPHLFINLLFENIFDQTYRVHGSGINGPGRSLILQAEGRF